MKKENLKMLQVSEETHTKAKKQAVIKGMSIKSYIKFLIDKQDKKKN